MTAATQWDVPLWQAVARNRLAYPALQGEVDVDLAVIGGGFTGLSTALHAAERGLSVVVLEAETLTWGATGRNAGFVVPNFAKMDPEMVIDRLGVDAGERLLAMAAGSADLVFDLIARHGIECDATQAGWIQAAYSDASLARVRGRAAQWAVRGRPVAALDRDEVTALTGVAGYRGGWIDRSGGTLNPVEFAYGLAGAALRAGTGIYEQSRVGVVAPDGAGWRVETASGIVRAKRVILATNAHVGELHPGLARSFFPLRVFQVATYPLPVEMRARLLPGAQGASDTRRNLFTFRFDRANRLISGGMNILPFGEKRVPLAIHQRMKAILSLPDLPPLEFAWSGVAAVMPDFLPRVIEIGPGYIAGIACNGRGIAMTVAMGKALAGWAAGEGDLPVPIGPPAPLPLHGLAKYAPNLLLPVSMFRDWREERG